MTQSIRSQLLVAVLGTVIVFGIIIIAYTWVDTNRSTNEMFDLRLQREAQMLVMVAKEEHSNTSEGSGLVPGSTPHPDLIIYQSDMAVQVWIAGRLRALTEGTPGFPEPSDPGFADVELESDKWRVLYFGEDFASESGGTVAIWVAVGEPIADRQAVIKKLLWQSSLPLFGIIFLLVVTLYSGIGRALKPLHKLRNQIVRRSPSSLKPVAANRTPHELNPIVDALNELLQKLDIALEREKRFTSDAAHELRTPLSALKAQAQVALRETDRELRGRALNNLIQGVERATHLVNQLLTIARLDPTHADLDQIAFEVVPSLEEMLADLAPEALERGVELTLESHCPDAVVTGERTLIQTMLRNIVHNAIIYAPGETGKVVVSIAPEKEDCRVTVIDNGPGIPAAESSRVFDRFYRIPGNASFGAGLGLSIASRIARLHHTQLAFDDNPTSSGLCVSVVLPNAKRAGLDESAGLDDAADESDLDEPVRSTI